MKKQSAGFTLIEVMVAVAIVGILAAIAYPAYIKQEMKSNRGNAEAQLMQMGQAMERWYSGHDAYPSAAASIGFSQSPPNGTAVYTLSITYGTGTQPAYTLVATPSSTALNKNNGNITIDSTGKQCWQKLSSTDCTSWSSN